MKLPALSIALTLGVSVGLILTASLAEEAAKEKNAKPKKPATKEKVSREGMEIATLGAGCFWCIEAVLEQLDGVKDVVSGYMGGHVKNPTYEQICTKKTGHAEVVQVVFDPKLITYDKLLSYFWKLHDPTTLNRQGGDEGPQYRSAIFYHSEEQRAKAEAQKKKIDKSDAFEDPIVTEITKASTFYEAEDYHQDYYRLNKDNPRANWRYCRAVITPKLDKLGLEK